MELPESEPQPPSVSLLQSLGTYKRNGRAWNLNQELIKAAPESKLGLTSHEPSWLRIRVVALSKFEPFQFQDIPQCVVAVMSLTAESGESSFSPHHPNVISNIAKGYGRIDAGKTTFIKAVRNAFEGIPGSHNTEEPTLDIMEYDVTLPDGRSLTFLDTPGFDGYHPVWERAKETEEILQMVEEHLAAKE
ncbi:hypothetical protein DFP72DRAFT_852465 [Ephemerocybe angulata]|uniref:G domain-containing protein n=1 Tax=Ephemerocybe angulata TaxID=980116 RepID=A0A8H6M1B0_9AGAR|nr:hypothetical protein DFP72DRAFT_852465 [Tulosesus angulatus]